MKSKGIHRAVSLVTAAALAVALPLGAFAATFDLSEGSITVTAEKESNWVKQENDSERDDADEYDTTKGNKYKKEVEIEIKQSNKDKDSTKDESDTSGIKKTATDKIITIKADEDAEVEVTLDNVNINRSKTGKYRKGTEGEAAVTVEAQKGSTVKLELDGDNVVKSGVARAGIDTGEESNTGTLVIQDETGEAGSLNATGHQGGAGIGSGTSLSIVKDSYNNDQIVTTGKAMNTDITITGGKVTATAGSYSTGIGSGRLGQLNGDITITGGEVTATGGAYSAGIGSSGSGDPNADIKPLTGNITITGGQVTATSRGGAGIGTGGQSSLEGDITITGGHVSATGSSGGAGIGLGSAIFETGAGYTYKPFSSYGSIKSTITIGGDATVEAYGSSFVILSDKSSNTETGGYFGAGIGTGSSGRLEEGAQIIIKDNAEVTAVSGGSTAASIGTGTVRELSTGNLGQNNGTVQILDHAKVLLGTTKHPTKKTTEITYDGGYIGGGTDYQGKTIADGSSASYEVDCTVTINDNEVESTYREDMSTSEWLWENIKSYIHYTPGTTSGEVGEYGEGTYKNGTLTINCHGHAPAPEPEVIDQTNTGVIASTDPAAQRWYWVTALFEADENVGYTYEQIGSNLIVNADEAAQAAVLHVLLTGWAEHTEVQSITFVTAGKTTTLYASDMLGITTGEHLTLTHEYEKATLAVDGRDYTYLLGEAAA